MNPHALAHRAHRHGWDVQTIPRSSGPVVILQRDGWRLEIAFDGHAPKEATANQAGQNTGRQLNLRSINDFVHRPGTDRLTHPRQDRRRAAHRKGDHEAGRRPGDRRQDGDSNGTE
ncbi:hypothetical protein [Nonomuraea jiangxiensis]|uniref:Uncharacterized protein n=1 Tax=Nonomuraea jiangxiensis TaxID=633440 RepID=A0A1G9NBH9_9ACTN|nr:hypothetical protein [Nonomuraea jiangxiensis]SDL83477.1 hypothetical protein SAMN05421869_13187 [Nonomuraea jiangxiensis]